MQALLDCLLLTIVAVSSGHLLKPLLKDTYHESWYTAAGLWLVPIYSVLLQSSGLLSLTESLQLLIGVGTANLLVRWRSLRSWDFKRDPLLYCILSIGILWALGVRNHPHEWDEFSHWLTMPLQMKDADTILSPKFGIKTFSTYTPSWPILLNLPQAMSSGVLDDSRVWVVSWFSGFLTLRAVWFWFLSRFGYGPLTLPAVAILGLLPISKAMFRASSLIEGPGFQASVLVWIFIFDVVHRKITPFRQGICAGVLALICFYLKKPYLILLVPMTLAMITELRSKAWVPLLQSAFILSAGYLLWNTMTADYVDLWSKQTVAPHWPLVGWERSIVPRVVEHSLRYVHFFLLALIAVLLIRGISRESRRFGRVAGIYFVFFVLSLSWTYIFSFGSGEGAALASSRRYLQVALEPAQFVLVLVLIGECLTQILLIGQTSLIYPNVYRAVAALAVFGAFTLPLKKLIYSKPDSTFVALTSAMKTVREILPNQSEQGGVVTEQPSQLMVFHLNYAILRQDWQKEFRGAGVYLRAHTPTNLLWMWSPVGDADHEEARLMIRSSINDPWQLIQ